MADDLTLTKGISREETYKEILPQIEALVEGETDMIANLGNVAAVLKEAFEFLWIGFYLVKNNELVLGPFQGPVACTRIQKGKGVCGECWQTGETIIVPDVDQFPGHIACSSSSKSEIVLPIRRNQEIIAILDIDSNQLQDFSEVDNKYLLEAVKLLEKSMG